MSAEKPYRYGVIGVFLDENNRALICERANVKGAWQFPQGGIDEGETPDQALRREVMEELGTDQFEMVARALETTTYEFPPEADFPVARKFIGQRHYWYLLRFVNGGVPDLGLSDGEFIDTKWVSLEQALENTVAWKIDAYKIGMMMLGLGGR